MKPLKQISFIGLALTFILSSCSMEKRVHLSGYHIKWENAKNNSNKQEFSKTNTNNEVLSENESTVETTVAMEPTEISFTDNSELFDNALIASVDNSVIVLEPPKINLNNKSNKPVVSENFLTSYETKTIIKEQKKQNKKVDRKTTTGGGKSQIVALILCILLGLIGVHRFYLGYTGLGLLYLLTFGLFGIGWLIDLILLIIPNGLTPKGQTNYK